VTHAVESNLDKSWDAPYELDSANKKYYQVDSNQPLFTPHDLSHFFAAHGLEFFNLKEFNQEGIYILETHNIYSIPKNVLSQLKDKIPFGIMFYFKGLPKGCLFGWKYESFSLPKKQMPYVADCVTLDYLIDSPNSIRFIMDD
jgi:hypothetical protein